jgi:hypothetical protein
MRFQLSVFWSTILRGTLAYVFLDKVTSFAASYRLVVAHVLACALSHEIGHLLLPPNAHRPDSVMRDGWHPALFPPRAPGLLGFPPDQAKLCGFAHSVNEPYHYVCSEGTHWHRV